MNMNKARWAIKLNLLFVHYQNLCELQLAHVKALNVPGNHSDIRLEAVEEALIKAGLYNQKQKRVLRIIFNLNN